MIFFFYYCIFIDNDLEKYISNSISKYQVEK